MESKASAFCVTLADEVLQAGLGKFPTATKKLGALLA